MLAYLDKSASLVLPCRSTYNSSLTICENKLKLVIYMIMDHELSMSKWLHSAQVLHLSSYLQ